MAVGRFLVAFTVMTHILTLALDLEDQQHRVHHTDYGRERGSVIVAADAAPDRAAVGRLEYINREQQWADWQPFRRLDILKEISYQIRRCLFRGGLL